MRRLVCIYLLLFSSLSIQAQLRLPSLISNGMVLQRDTPLKIWGWAKAGEKITVELNKKRYRTTTDASGKWLVKLAPMPAGGPFTMTIVGNTQLAVNDILIGDSTLR